MVLDKLTHPDLRGDEFADTLSPIIDAIGMDVREGLSMVRERNLIVEGICDHLYVSAAARQLLPGLLVETNIFPAFGAHTVPTFASLFVGWGLPFAVLLDRDSAGNKTKAKLEQELLLEGDCIVQPRDATTIEDLFSTEDFRSLLREVDGRLTMEAGERPSEAITRQGVDKVLIANCYSELMSKGTFKATQKTHGNLRRLLEDVARAAGVKKEAK